MNFQALHKQRKFILIVAVIGVISVFLPWFTVSAEGLGLQVSQSVSGFHDTGILVCLAFIVAGILALAGDQSRIMDKTMWMATLCAGAVALIFVAINLARTPNSGDTLGFAQAGPGFGIWIALVAAIGTLAAAWLLKNSGDTLKGGFDSLKHDLGNLSGAAAPTVSAPTASAPTVSATGAPNASSPNATESRSRIDELERLIELRNQGKISEEEYQRMKSKLL